MPNRYPDREIFVFGPTEIIPLTIPSGTPLSDAFDMSDYRGGAVYVPGTWTAGNIGFKCSDTLTGTYDITLDKNGVPIQIGTISTGRAGWYAIPTELTPHEFVKLWSKSTLAAIETDVNQSAQRAMKVALK